MYMRNKILFITLCISPHLVAVAPLLMPRSQSTNLARELIQCYPNRLRTHDAQLFATPQIVKTFRPELVAQSLFGPLLCAPIERLDVVPHCNKARCHVQKRECRSSIIVAGSQSSKRTATSVLADYCALPTDFASIVHFKPHYSSALVDFGGYIPCDSILKNSYIFIHTPLEHTWWALNTQETILSTGTTSYVAGYLDSGAVPRNHLLDSFLAFAQGTQVPTLTTTHYGPLQYAHMSCSPHSVTGLADVQIALGWIPVLTERYCVEGAARIVVPTGTRPHATTLFEPIIGNGRHWQLGFELIGHVLAWENAHHNESFTFEVAFIANHLFSCHQRRTFDLHEKPLSRYMLAEQMDMHNVDNLHGSGTTPAYLFAGRFEPVANLTTSLVNVSINLECELSFLLTFNRDQFSWHIGYGLWAQHGGTITICDNRLAHETWALKGDAQVFGFIASADAPLVQNQAIPLSATESAATINSGTNAPVGTTDFSASEHNPAIDSPTQATAGNSNTRLLYQPNLPNSADNQINTSRTPILLTTEDIDVEDTRIRHIENSLFMHFTYTINTNTTITPTIGLGAQAVFGQSEKNPATSACAINRAFSSWALWVHVGVLLD